MRDKSEILVIEDDLVTQSNLEILLDELGYGISGVTDNGLEAMSLFSKNEPDLVIADIGLPGDIDGIELVKRLTEIKRVPVVFLTAHVSQEVYFRAKSAHPYAYITKPIDRANLDRVIDLALEHYQAPAEENPQPENVLVDSESLYTRIGNKLKKILISDITHIDVNGKYCGLNRKGNGTYVNIKMSLKELMERLPARKFVQVNRNCVVNMDFVEDVEIQQLHLDINGHRISISRVYKDNLFRRLNIV